MSPMKEGSVSSRSIQLENLFQLFSAVIEHSLDGINITDLQGNISYCNDVSCLLYGYLSQEMLGVHVRKPFQGYFTWPCGKKVRDSYKADPRNKNCTKV